ncbi:hypothetical protein BG006_001287 [Podila minutissima]|uniref:RING-type domain-containing protein n=1 Tax=Podila minutissima TaxID=64525 RepID=A0A9P5SAF6_9FUNG|nr:hypothetical protein BG006_001287 [Podila minutissima]
MNTPANDVDNVEQDQHTSVCAICLGPIQGRVYLSPCMHSFCATCLSAWLAVALHCPLCKAVPSKLHWGVNTALGILHTIHIGQSGPGFMLTSSASWRAELKRVASLSEEQEQSSTNGQGRQEADESDKESTPSEADEADDDEEEQEESFVGSTNGKRRRSASFEGNYHDGDSEDRSRSRSVTPIDSCHHYYGDSDSSNAKSNILSKRSKTEATLPSEANTSSPTAPTPPTPPRPTRREIYLYGMEPVPTEEYPLADQILPTDLELLKPFLERDLAVLTDVHTRGDVEGIVVDHVTNVLRFHANSSQGAGAKQQAQIENKIQGAKSVDWVLVEKEVEQWVLLSPEWTNMTQSRIAQLFVREMRRIAKRRWRMGSWDERVEYRRCNVDTETNQI